jgi:hypothetical protein
MTISASGAVSLPTSSLTITSGATLNGGVVVNEDGADVDFRIESDTNTHALFVNGATGEVLVGGSTELTSAKAITVIGTGSGSLGGSGTLSLYRPDTTIVAGEAFGRILFWGNDTTSNTPTAHAIIAGLASGTHGPGDNPTDLVFYTTPDGTETIAEAGRITQAGSYVLKGGTTTAAAGVGIIFPATQVASANANSLDDYEEGTWTPVDGSGAGLSFTVLDARYTKIGRMVECYAQINYPATANGNNAAIGGLPFTMASTVGGSYGAFTAYTNYDQATWLGSAESSSTFAYNLAGGSIANSTISEKQFRLVWIYEV